MAHNTSSKTTSTSSKTLTAAQTKSIQTQISNIQAGINKAAAEKGVTLVKQSGGTYKAVPISSADTRLTQDRQAPEREKPQPQLKEVPSPSAIEGQDLAPDGTPPTPPVKQPGAVGQLPFDQALTNLRSGGLQGQQLAQAERSLENAYGRAHQQMVGGVVPGSFGEFQSQVDTGALATSQEAITPQSPMDAFIQENPLMGGLIDQMRNYMNLDNRRGTLVQEYQSLSDRLGIEALNLEAMNLKNIIEGTEDDIRLEVTKAGGFATDSQVLALTNSRNKDNIKAYNRLTDTINAKEKTLNTLIGLEAQDRQAADQRFMNMFNMTAQIAQYQQQFNRDARDNLRWTASQPGGFEALQAEYFNNPTSRGLMNKMFGGFEGLQRMATAAAEDRGLQQTLLQEQILTARAQRSQIGAPSRADIIAMTEKLEREQAELSGALDGMSLANEIMESEKLKLITGKSRFFDPRAWVGMPGTQLIKNQVNQLRQVLSLENRQKLKGQGTVSDFEGRMLSEAATSLTRSLSDNDFKRELAKVRGAFANASGLTATVRITDPKTGQSKLVDSTRDGINNALLDGLKVEYAF